MNKYELALVVSAKVEDEVFSSIQSLRLRANWNRDFALWTTCSDTYA